MLESVKAAWSITGRLARTASKRMPFRRRRSQSLTVSSASHKASSDTVHLTQDLNTKAPYQVQIDSLQAQLHALEAQVEALDASTSQKIAKVADDLRELRNKLNELERLTLGSCTRTFQGFGAALILIGTSSTL